MGVIKYNLLNASNFSIKSELSLVDIKVLLLFFTQNLIESIFFLPAKQLSLCKIGIDL